MNRRGNVQYLAFLIALIAVLGGLAMIKGVFLVGQHEGDVLHLAQIMVLLKEGWRAHFDFMTPIGFLAFWPMEVLVKAGLPMGKAFFLGQVMVACALLPAIWWVGISRFSKGLSYIMGAVVLAWVLALVHGEATPATSMSMHYNRWAWAITALVLFTAVLPSLREQRVWADAAVIGTGMAVLGLSKATFAVAFVPGILVVLIAGGRGGTVLRALLVAGGLLGVVTLLRGTEFWIAYVGDLLEVMQSQTRAFPHRPLGNVLAAPEFMGATLLLAASIVVLRHGGRQVEGLAILLLAPAFVYVTYQNYGNDPKWLPILGLMLAMLLPAAGERALYGWDLRPVQVAMVVIAFTLNLPSLINIASSTWRNRSADVADYTVLVPGAPLFSDVLIPSERITTIDLTLAAEYQSAGVDHLRGAAQRAALVEIAGEQLPVCRLGAGLIGQTRALSDELAALGVVEEGASVLVADVFSALWLFGKTEPLAGMSPWYYGGAPGVDKVDYLSVPFCPIRDSDRKQVVETAFGRDDLTLTEVARGQMQILYRVKSAEPSR